ncbi:2-succinyl-6-hydroxy-2,4-cyclohexadiene-1-carboxylate synthase [Solibacillus isronensis B3W22]|uniref:2-succinyl-6-hydroxy-2, 4-cyclohexadiene-1-carboxylate synthase n=1 Tax=Solibacillus isronensis B3W22 TaxID=1224748 RepID=K1L2P5_9BACL|nr:alpha/beta hydrolase [Solibacillus isronensis]AMO85706.1 2-succinyl-6-hydroxy-2,4-cyclohexadiene-1-carboxylate synthase [Solibacillus silvestris]EKB46352.1 2-succinyl-6-hydroxy-2,4-cyclohexadiene-1-carboxylate synthase [Solibacillus isronensis B3W22]
MRYIFVQGLGQSSSSWEKTISFLGDKEQFSHPDVFQLLNEEKKTYSNLYDAFSDYIEQFSEPVILIGLSLGAILSLNYAIDHPKKFQSLVLIAPQYKMPKSLLKMQNIIFRFMPETPFQKLGSSKNDFIQLTNTMMELNFSKALKGIECNTLVICGKKDIANKRAAKQVAKLIPNGYFQEIEGVGHEINTEAPEKLASILKEFLKK